MRNNSHQLEDHFIQYCVRQELQVALTQELTGSMIGQPKTDSS